jgi:hypothetical protein
MTYKITIFEDGYSNKVTLVHATDMAKASAAGRRECDTYHKMRPRHRHYYTVEVIL